MKFILYKRGSVNIPGSHWAVLQANPTLLAAIKALLNAAEPLALETTLAYHLESLGLISLKGEHAAIDRQLYRQYFVNQLRIAPCLDFSPLAQTSGSLQQQLTNFEKKNQILEQLLQIDDITQFLNRQTFGLYLTNLWETVIQRQQPLALMIVNIDHLKTYIEAFGHEKGDLCVQKIASLIRSIISQPAEHFARYGMDEFVILLLNTPEPDAHRLAATVQAQVEALNLYHAPQSMGLPLPVVTVSIGMVSGIPEIGSSSNDYLSGANQALEKAIRHGGNTFYAIEGTKIYAVETTAVAIVKH